VLCLADCFLEFLTSILGVFARDRAKRSRALMELRKVELPGAWVKSTKISEQHQYSLETSSCLPRQQKLSPSSQEPSPLHLLSSSQQQIIMAVQQRARANEWLEFC
jgi:hypothetical protein